MTQTRQQEIALSKYLGYTLQSFGENRHLKGPGATDKAIDFEAFVRMAGSDEEVWATLAPHFASDESLLSPLMKGLAEKGVAVDVQHSKPLPAWYASLNQDDYEGKGDSPIRALFEAATQLPEVQQLLTQTTEHQA